MDTKELYDLSCELVETKSSLERALFRLDLCREELEHLSLAVVSEEPDIKASARRAYAKFRSGLR